MKKKKFLENSRKTALSIFLIALIVRLSLFVIFGHNFFYPDSTGYHAIAVNLVKGNGFSNQKTEPFSKYYFREPGYPLFLAGIYSIVNIFHPIEHIKGYDAKTHTLAKNYLEIYVAQIIQIILDSIGIVLLFFSLIKIANKKIAFLTCFLTAIFINLATFSSNILRESLVVFLLLCLNFFYIQHIQLQKNFLRLSIMGLIIGFLIMTFQVNVVLLPVFFIMILLKTKKFLQTLFETSLVTLISLLIVIPYCIHVYNYYPNIKIFKTFGTSLTYELIECFSAIEKLVYYGKISRSEASIMNDLGKDSHEQFEKSFNGYYLNKAASWNAMVPEPVISKRKLVVFYLSFRRSFFLDIFYLQGRKELTKKYGLLITVPLVLLPVLIGIMGLFGLIIYGRKYLIYFLPFTAYAMLFWLLGDEQRRGIILHPFLIFFGLLVINEKIKKRFGFKKKT